ncbi:COG4315 family predicted lipoprotein [Yinghuangia seranimata]|uniref:COG4315 family predicted lipoprotein n=1 Tax=Yinghuangia seranimata TaxID=408067 RepID=UPI00248B43D2|nr:hypothetical protein [Yinghuangia seranimata]MDI2124628.1 hypothetical protein [Yinghuangia seranimata]
MPRPRLVIASIGAAALAAALVGGCSDNNKSSTSKTSPPASSAPAAPPVAPVYPSASPTAGATGSPGVGAASLSTQSVDRFGQVLVDAKSKTLYLFEADTSSTSTCYDSCAAAWPPALVTGTPTAGSGVDQSKLSTTTRQDGGTQLVYNGHPLYTYTGDTASGQANGEESTAFGAKWYLVNGDGNKVEGD